MAIAEINTVHMSLLGLCFLENEQKTVLKREWDDRIDAETALWVDLDPSEGYDQILDKVLKAISSRQGVIARKQCVIAAFLDFQQELSPELPEILKRLQETIDLVLNRTTNAILQFGYVGIRGLSNGPAARKNAALFAESNGQRPAAIQHRICLVGSEFTRIGDENNWRAAAVLLDLLRRQHSIVDFLPTSPNGVTNDDVGYLRYAEYDMITYSALLEEAERIKLLQGSSGEKALFDLYVEKRAALRQEIKERFYISNNVHPLHPGLKVTGFLHVRQARHGNYKPYNEAATATRNAVEQTVARMEKDIKQYFSQKTGTAREELLSMLAEAKVGLSLKQNNIQMHAILNVTQPGGRPIFPDLSYKPEGPSGDIQAYLIDMRRHITDCCISEYEKNIQAAYDELYRHGFEEEEQQLSRDLAQVNNQLSKLQTPEIILSTIQRDEFLPETCLAPKNVDGRQRGYVIFRGDHKTKELIDSLATITTAYALQPFADDPESRKTKPVKAVQMVVCDNSEPVLRGLINWRLEV